MKRYLMEAIGTFFLMLAISLGGNPLSIGLMLTAMIYIGAHISGGHFNPAVSFAMWMRKQLSSTQLTYYIIAQTIGAIVGIYGIKYAATAPNFSLCLELTTPFFVGFMLELLLSFVFCWVIITVTTVHTLKDTPIYGLVIGLTLTAAASIGLPMGIGALLNPAIATGSLFTDLLHTSCERTPSIWHFLVYCGGPLSGGALAAVAFDFFNTPQSSR